MTVSEIEERAGHDPIIKAFGVSTNNTARDVLISGKIVLASGKITLVPEGSFEAIPAIEAAWSRQQSFSPTYFQVLRQPVCRHLRCCCQANSVLPS
ncbi:hypothetical protein MAPG_04073 [Magnaporthiopsis poae ATCC 64411]|uniref:Uncharacterized protein n=1 Tax=Magnaporthiopsis poae (strain ATCC 64411 / 73-15) TaxID=644358 RepID=A0A0C4DVR2_MAGP6|nr:hypothetical protein MAPG_04073 [Magnaporthiopsis poae ATCC 64411]